MDSSGSNQPTEPPANPSPERKYYTTRTWFAALMGTATLEEQRAYLAERDVIYEQQDFERCEAHKNYLFQYSMHPEPLVPFLYLIASFAGY
jgi:hypothetical protein